MAQNAQNNPLALAPKCLNLLSCGRDPNRKPQREAVLHRAAHRWELSSQRWLQTLCQLLSQLQGRNWLPGLQVPPWHILCLQTSALPPPPAHLSWRLHPSAETEPRARALSAVEAVRGRLKGWIYSCQQITHQQWPVSSCFGSFSTTKEQYAGNSLNAWEFSM